MRSELSSDGPGMLLLATENPLHVSPGKSWSVLKKPGLSGCDTDAGFLYQARQKSTRSGLTDPPAPWQSSVSSLPVKEAICKTYPRWGRTRQAVIKVMNCKIERDKDDRRACSETNFTLHLLPHVIVNVFVYAGSLRLR